MGGDWAQCDVKVRTLRFSFTFARCCMRECRRCGRAFRHTRAECYDNPLSSWPTEIMPICDRLMRSHKDDGTRCMAQARALDGSRRREVTRPSGAAEHEQFGADGALEQDSFRAALRYLRPQPVRRGLAERRAH